MTSGARALAAVAVVVALFGTIVIAIRASYGAFKGGYVLTATFPRAAYGFGINSEIDYLGIDVGHVTHVVLRPDHQVEAYLKIKASFAVPVGTKADVHNRSLFGDPYVALVFPSSSAGGDLMHGGDSITVTSVDADTNDLIRTGSNLLDNINGQDLLSVVTSLDQATAGEGDKIAQSIHDGAQLAALYSDTLTAQLKALDSFTAFQTAVTPDAADLNTLSAQGNRALPTLNAAENDFQQVLDSVSAFATKLAAVIAQERPDFDALLSRGDNLVRLLTMREPQIEQVIQGSALYFQKFAQGESPETLPNGSKFAYFKAFVEFNDVAKLICGLVLPAAPASLTSALAGAGISCPALSPAASAAATASAKQDLATGAADQIAQPSVPAPFSLSDMINRILGRG